MTAYLRPFFRSALLLATFAAAASAWAQVGAAISNEKIFESIGVREGLTVCEIGAGDGELSLAAARAVGPSGRVLTSELGAERVKSLHDQVAKSGLAQITVVTGDPVKTNFPDAACDALFMRSVYHHFADPKAMNTSIAAALKPGGRYAVVDFTPPPGKEAAVPADRGKDGMHGVTPETVSREMKESGFEVVSAEPAVQRSFIVVAMKPKQQRPSSFSKMVLVNRERRLEVDVFPQRVRH